MPVYKLTLTQKREIVWRAEAKQKPIALAAAYGVTRQYVYQLIRAAKINEYAFMPCDYCGSENLAPEAMYCCPECETNYERVQDHFLNTGQTADYDRMAGTVLHNRKRAILDGR